MRRFLIDTDTGSDDAVALVMALKHPDVTVEAVTIVAGNVPLEQGAQNALYTVELCGSTVPVFRGVGAPLLSPVVGAEEVHGLDGMGDIGLPLSGREPAPGHAVDVLVEKISASPGELTLVTLGPLTNVALALLRDPSISVKVNGCVMMGGTGQGPGNVTPVAEYNIWADPEAAKVVFESGMPLMMVGWDISRRYAVFGPDDSARLRGIGTPLAEFCVDIQRVLDEWARENTRLAGFDLPDPIAMAIALDPSVATEMRRLFVAVETGGAWSRGQTVVDHLNVAGREPNVEVVVEASRERFLDLLHAAVGR
ncbi:MAG: Inosine-uridine preferring nucleoside hydrolase [uncultured Rubrobacteraceae bacterium]|uniref:Inosine-uridine preferring nucleoside hydrolase n=1 Tax=uncultured Rubrobacteraceae bacterium TaxID=349277 RepID=A0A6J4QT14_9ACTN|nr:MAG: Inosine-uridine preferring nucleoside hydrolase [uncultured Rubrobacteraceae bacterium]